MISLSTVRKINIIFIVSILYGCVSTPQSPPEQNEFEELYKGKSKALYSTMLPPSSAKEAAARADKAILQGQEDKALYLYVQSLGMNSENPAIFEKIANIYTKKGNDKLSAIAFSYALKIDPNYAPSQQGLGLILFRNKKADQAKSFFESAIKNDPKLWRSFNALGIIADLDGEFIQAQDYYHSALALAPGSPKVLNNLAYSYFLQGQRQESIDLYKKILSYSSKNTRAWTNLGLVYAREGLYQNSFAAFKNIMDDAESYNMVGYLIMIEQQYLSSRPDIEKYHLAGDYFDLAVETSSRYFKKAHDNLDRLNSLIKALDDIEP